MAFVASFIEFLSQKQLQDSIISQNNLAEVVSTEIQEVSASNSFTEPSEIDEEGQSKAALLQDFRQAWHEAMTGQTILVAQLWEGIENDDRYQIIKKTHQSVSTLALHSITD